MKSLNKKALVCLLAAVMVFENVTGISVSAKTNEAADATGAAGDSFASAAAMQEGEEYTVTIAEGGLVYYKFTSGESGSYDFYVKGGYAEDVYLLDENQDEIGYDYGMDCKISCNLESQTTCYLVIYGDYETAAQYKIGVNRAMLSLSYESWYTVNYGEEETLEVTAASGRGPVSYQWYEWKWSDESEDYEYKIISGATQSSYTVTADTEEEESKKYQCVVTDGTETKTAEISLSVKTITCSVSYPSSVEKGETVTMQVQAESLLGRELTYQWYHEEMVEDEYGDEENDYVLIPGATDSIFQMIAENDSDTYKCEISDGTRVVDVDCTIRITTRIGMTGQTKHFVKQGESVMFQVKAASFSGRSLTYEWQKRNEGEYIYSAIAGADGASYTVRAEEGTTPYYRCEVSDGSKTVFMDFEFQIISSKEKEIDRIVPGEGWPTEFVYESVIRNPGNSYTNFTYTKPLIVKYKDGTEKTVSYGYCCWLDFDFSSESGNAGGGSKAYISYMGKTVSYDVSLVKMSEAGTDLSLGEKITDQAGVGNTGRKYYSVSIPAGEKYVIQISDLSGEAKENVYFGLMETPVTDGCYEPHNGGGQIYFSVESAGAQPISYSIQADTVPNISRPLSASETMQESGYYRITAEESGLYEVVDAGADKDEQIAALYNEELQSLCTFYNQSTRYYLQAGETYYIRNRRRGAKFQLAEAKSLPTGTKAGAEDRINWNLTDDGILTIEGEGDIPDNRSPWKYYNAAYGEDQTIQKVSIQNGITGIGTQAFYFCSELREAELPDSLSFIGAHAFRSCKKLQTAAFPKNLTEIKAWAFGECTELTEITFPAQLKEIGMAAFYNCTLLNQVNIAGDGHFDYIGDYAFDGTAWADRQGDFVILGDTLLDYTGTAKEITIPDTVYQIGVHGFSGSAAEKITMNSHITKIWEYGFSRCGSLKEINVPGSVTDIAYQAFSGCTALERAVLNQGVKNIEYNAFEGCNSLKNLSLEEGLETVGDRAFLNNGSLKQVTVPKSVNTIGEHAFGYAGTYQWDSGWMFTKETAPVTLRCYPDSKAHQYAAENALPFALLDENGQEIEKPNQNNGGNEGNGSAQLKTGTSHPVNNGTYEIISNKTVAFTGLIQKNSKNFEIPDKVTIKGVQFEVTAVGDQAFAKANIKSVTMPSGIQSIGTKAFYNCKKLKKITIPASVGKIGSQAFGNCKKLKNITVKTTKLTAQNVGKKAFKGISAKAVIRVPKQKLKLYKKIFKSKGAGNKVKFKK